MSIFRDDRTILVSMFGLTSQTNQVAKKTIINKYFNDVSGS